MEHWTDGLTHQDLITPKAKAVLGEYNSNEDALVAGLEAKSKVGEPFRLPNSIEGIPSDAQREDFHNQLGKLMGAVENDEAMADVNFADGLPDAKMVNEDFVTAAKAFAIEYKVPVALLKKFVLFNNQFSLKARQDKDNTAVETATKINGELSSLFGGDEGIKKHNENVRKMFQNHGGLTADEFEAVVPGLVDSGITKSTPLSKALYNIAGKFPEGTTEGSQVPGSKVEEGGIKQQLPVTAKILGW